MKMSIEEMTTPEQLTEQIMEVVSSEPNKDIQKHLIAELVASAISEWEDAVCFLENTMQHGSCEA